MISSWSESEEEPFPASPHSHPSHHEEKAHVALGYEGRVKQSLLESFRIEELCFVLKLRTILG